MKASAKDYFNVAVRLWIGAIFLSTGWMKAVEPFENFRGVLSHYGLLPQVVLPLIAHSIPWIELITGLFLVVGYALPLAVIAAGALSGSFVLLLGISFLTQSALPEHCGCFGSGIQMVPAQMLILDTVHLVLTLAILRYPSSFFSIDRIFVTPLNKKG